MKTKLDRLSLAGTLAPGASPASIHAADVFKGGATATRLHQSNPSRAITMKTMNNLAMALALAAGLALTAQPAQAVLIAYEGFDYATGSLYGQNGGTGWSSGNWTSSASGTITTQATSLTYETLPVTGNKVYVQPISQTTRSLRELGTTFGTIGSSAYVSVLMNYEAGTRFFALSLYNGGTERAYMGKPSGGGFWRLQSGGVFENTAVTATSNQTFFLVMKADYISSNRTDYSLWVDPALGGSESTPLETITVANNLGFNTISLGAGFNGGADTTATGWFDEVRVGTTWESVTIPEPSTWAMLTGGLIALTVLRRRRRKS